MFEDIKRTSEDCLTLCFPGVGSAFAKKNNQTSLIIAKNGKTILVDAGTTIPVALHQNGVPFLDFDHYFITHTHADHIGGLEELLLMSRYTRNGKKVSMIITDGFQDTLWNKSLRGGVEYSEAKLLRFSDVVEPVRPRWVKASPREMYEVDVDGIHLLIFRTKHIPGDAYEWESSYWSTGIVIDHKVMFTADTKFDPSIFSDIDPGGLDAIFHDCQLFDPGSVHASYNELKTLPDGLKERMYLTHYGDSFDRFKPEEDGFGGFAEQWKIYPF